MNSSPWRPVTLVQRLEPRFWRLALACLLGGCASDALNLAPPRPDRPWHPRTDASGAILAGEPAISGGTGSSAHVLPGNTRIAGIAPSPGIDREHPYTLPELIDLAESNNPLTRIAWNAAREIALAAGIAKSAYLPRLTAAAVGGHQNYSMTVSNPLGGAGNSSSGEGSISSVSLNWLLYDFGLREAAVEAATQASVVSNIGFTAAHQEVIHAVTLAFYAHTAAEARVKLAEQSLRNTETVEAAARERLNQGPAQCRAGQGRDGKHTIGLVVRRGPLAAVAHPYRGRFRPEAGTRPDGFRGKNHRGGACQTPGCAGSLCQRKGGTGEHRRGGGGFLPQAVSVRDGSLYEREPVSDPDSLDWNSVIDRELRLQRIRRDGVRRLDPAPL